MTQKQWMTMGWLLAAAVLVGVSGRAHGQVREPQRQEARGAVKALDLTKQTISIAFGGGGREPGRAAATEESYALAQDVEVAIATGGISGRGGLYRKGKLADLAPGTTVSLALSSDRTKVEGIVAEEPSVRGVLQKIVDAATKTLTIGRGGERGVMSTTYTLADDAEVAVDDGRGRRFSIREGQLSDLVAGATVTLSNAAAKTLTLSLGSPGSREMLEERIVAVADNALIVLDDGKGRRLSLKAGKLDEIPAGATVIAKLSADQTRAMQVRLEGARLTGILKGADANKGTITITIPRGRTEPPEERTFSVAKDARVLSEGNIASLASLTPQGNGPVIELRLSLDQMQAQTIVARQPQAR